MTKTDFIDWLKEQLKNKNWSQAEFARQTKLSPAQITRLLNGERGIGETGLTAIAHALNLPPDLVFEKAGIFAPKSTDPIIAEITHLASQLPPEDVQDLIDLARSKIQRHERTANAARKLGPG